MTILEHFSNHQMSPAHGDFLQYSTENSHQFTQAIKYTYAYVHFIPHFHYICYTTLWSAVGVRVHNSLQVALGVFSGICSVLITQ